MDAINKRRKQIMNSIINTMLVTLTIVILFNQICISDSIMPTGFENIYIGMTKSEFKTARPSAKEDTDFKFGGDLPQTSFNESITNNEYFSHISYYFINWELNDIIFNKHGCYHIDKINCIDFNNIICRFLYSCIEKYGNNYEKKIWYYNPLNSYRVYLKWILDNKYIYALYTPDNLPSGGVHFSYYYNLIFVNANHDDHSYHFLTGADPDDYPELFEEIPSQGECTPAPIFNTATPTPTPTVTPTPT